jgi:hypothetical protein
MGRVFDDSGCQVSNLVSPLGPAQGQIGCWNRQYQACYPMVQGRKPLGERMGTLVNWGLFGIYYSEP